MTCFCQQLNSYAKTNENQNSETIRPANTNRTARNRWLERVNNPCLIYYVHCETVVHILETCLLECQFILATNKFLKCWLKFIFLIICVGLTWQSRVALYISDGVIWQSRVVLCIIDAVTSQPRVTLCIIDAVTWQPRVALCTFNGVTGQQRVVLYIWRSTFL